ncbi:Transcriptional activator FeaR [compost metagenome]|uniref:AraC family transcriptional regulator, positive regulator of tynA and feaB n=1 Tax=Pseudomonas jinjuensis TaxID=198616 RepID=A0A1H0H382_9PSED|nr:transcriptional regulator FeaR [Pseudomonas jinjuensis]SDO13524.1 AraC family transcriptional regulator, positive regulator of tynA and feaB [Pseudomonas jinjuensis]
MSTSHQIRGDAFEAWLGRINQACGRFAARTLGPEFRSELREFQGGAIKLSQVELAHINLYRTRTEVAAGASNNYYAVFQLDGRSRLEQGDNRVELAAGDITLIDASQPSSMTYLEDARQVSLIVPRQVFERARLNSVSCATRIPGSAPIALLANNLVREVSRHDGLGMQESEATLDALVSLLRPAISAQESECDSHERLFRKAVAFIDEHISAEELCPELIAREVGVSVRGLYRMFSKKGTVVAQYIKNRRLDFCAESLRNAHFEQKLSALGYAWGFSDSSYFSTAFKSRFGVSPGEYRKRYTQ